LSLANDKICLQDVQSLSAFLPDRECLLCFQYVKRVGGEFRTGTSLALGGLWHDGFAQTDIAKSMNVQKRQSERGFTMIELMIVVAIMGLAASIAVPNYLTWFARYQLRQAVTEIQNQLSLARVSAMSRNSVVNVSLALNGGTVQISAADASGSSVIPITSMTSGVIGLNPAPSTIAFSPLGIRSGGGAGNQQLSLSNRYGLSYSVRVTPRGKVSWCPAATCP